MSLTLNQGAMLRKVVALATELNGHREQLLDRRRDLLAKRSERQRRLTHLERQRAAAHHAIAYPLDGQRDQALARYEREVADARAVLQQVNADLKAVDERIERANRDSGEASRLAYRLLEHQGVNEDLEPVVRLTRSPAWN